jgi:hypothetical protein
MNLRNHPHPLKKASKQRSQPVLSTSILVPREKAQMADDRILRLVMQYQ